MWFLKSKVSRDNRSKCCVERSLQSQQEGQIVFSNGSLSGSPLRTPVVSKEAPPAADG